MADFGKTTSQRLTEAELDLALEESRKWLENGRLAQNAKRLYIPLGADQHGRVIDGQRVYPAECCSDFGLDEDQSQSADREAWPIIAALVLTAVAIGSMIYSCAEYLPV